MGKVVTIFMSVDVPKCVSIKKYCQIEIILHSCIKQYGVFGLSDVTPILRISMTDYPNLITPVEGTSIYGQ